MIHHERFARNGEGVIYHGDDPMRPFAADAGKFAFFCAAVAHWLLARDSLPDVVHLHDWHAALFTALLRYDEKFNPLRKLRTVFTVHNLSYQGTRPLKDDESSFEAWFPGLPYDDAITDPEYTHCVNPMATAIRLADRVSTVSPTYAEEICRPSDPELAFIGGEGLEGELCKAADAGRLLGVLNGCFYDQPAAALDWPDLLEIMRTQVDEWERRDPGNGAHFTCEATAAKSRRTSCNAVCQYRQTGLAESHAVSGWEYRNGARSRGLPRR